MFMSLVRSKKVCSLFISLFVPVFDPLRFVEVMVILLAELEGGMLSLLERFGGHLFHEHP